MEQIRLDLIPNGIMPNVHASQFDKGRVVRFNLYEGDTPFTLLVTDNVKVACNGVEDTTLATAGTSHDWTIPDSVVSDSGVFLGELSVERGSKVIGSKNFVLNVEEDAYNGANIEERTASGSIANFETNLQDNLTACKCTINPLQSGTGTPSPSNPRAITGFSGANIVRCGKNLVYIKPFNQWTVISGYPCQKKAIRENTRVYMSLIDNDTSVDVSGCYFGFVADNFIGGALATNQFRWVLKNGTLQSITANYSEGDTTNFLSGLVFVPNNEATYNKIMARYKILISIEENVTTYEPYNGTTYAIPFGQTVYGGVLDVTNGKLRVTHGYQDLGGIDWTPYNNTFYAQLNNAKSPSGAGVIADIICSQYEADTLNHVLGKTTDGIIAINDQQSRVHIYDSAKSSMTGTQFKSAMSGVQLVYELATPTEITLTAKEIEALIGTNNVYHDCNGEIEVKYLVEV